MHPHLANEQNQLACAEIVDALERCRELGLSNRYLGGCNEAKHKLIMCLRKERVDRTAKHIQESREAKKSAKDAWRRHIQDEMHEQPS